VSVLIKLAPVKCVHEKVNLPIKTELINAVSENNLLTTKKLLDKGVNPNFYDKNKNTPLHIAVANNSLEMIDLLISYNALPNIKDKDGDTVFHKALSLKKEKIIDKLLEFGANPNLANGKKNLTYQYCN
jgi:ankyrin repeat protein